MSIIAVKKIGFRVSLPAIVKQLARSIKGQFEALNFKPDKGPLNEKTCYIRLSETLDPLLVVERINSNTKYRAYIPRNIPDLPLASKRGKIPFKLRKTLRIGPEDTNQLLHWTRTEILIEMQCKFTGLYHLSKESDHKLLEAISAVIGDRLKVILETHPESKVSGFMLSKTYRKLHPHFGDFQLILSTLHKVQDAAGTPRSQISETELIEQYKPKQDEENIAPEKVQAACMKYSERIVNKVTEYIKSLDDEPIAEGDTEEEIAKKKVRDELKKMSPYLPMIIKQVVTKTCVPQKQLANKKMRIYGEPYLPGKEAMSPFVRRFKALKPMRSDRMFNVLRITVPHNQYLNLMKQDGTLIGDAKLVIRSSEVPLLKPRGSGGQEDDGGDDDGDEDEAMIE